MMPSRRQLLLCALSLSGGLLLTGCGGSSDKPPEIEGNKNLPLWEGEWQTLYDDQINPASVGLSMSGKSPAEDPLLPLRAQSADVCARMRVQTVTRDTVGQRSSYLISLQVGVPTLMPARVDDLSFELAVAPNSNSFGIVQSMENSLRGRTFVGFVKRFAGIEGPELHYHLTSDNAEVAKAVQKVSLLEELTKE